VFLYPSITARKISSLASIFLVNDAFCTYYQIQIYLTYSVFELALIVV